MNGSHLYRVSKEVRWEAAHRLVGHPGLCKHIHGHSFRLKVTVGSRSLDGCGMAHEFSKIKKPLQEFIDDKLDHALILWEQDPLLSVLGEEISRKQELPEDVGGIAATQVYSRVWAAPCNPTSENLAVFFWDFISKLLPEGVALMELWFAETRSASVTLKAEDFFIQRDIKEV